MKYLLIIILLISSVVMADDLGFRVNSRLPDSNSSIIAFPPSINGVEGKQVNLFYDHYLNNNFYLEGSFGYQSVDNVFNYSGLAYELSPGVRINAGGFEVKFSEGVSYIPSNKFNPQTYQGYNPLNFVTHLTIGLRDPKTNIFFGLDRSHYSDGFPLNNPAQNFSGFVIIFPIGK